MRNYIINSVLAVYLGLASISNTSYAYNIPGPLRKETSVQREDPQIPPSDIIIIAPNPEQIEIKPDIYDYFEILYSKLRVFLDRNKQPTLAPPQGLENKVETKK